MASRLTYNLELPREYFYFSLGFSLGFSRMNLNIADC